ncbi:type II secretion system protein [Paenibacillus wynnii]|uniref:type II secretion system protein n=1 Tax=Paenibacillus wynnii TaxID=268407 RepID=UPI0006923562|nr:type II secretion system protein [Paenibacillus wynnii]
MLAQAIKRRLGKEENQKGFTLIELLAVIVILGIIAVIAVPMISGIINNSKKDADLATARQVYEAARLYVIAEKESTFAVTGGFNVTVADLKTKGYLEDGIVLPSKKAALTGGAVYFAADGTLVNDIAVTLKTTDATVTANDKSFTEVEINTTKRN